MLTMYAPTAPEPGDWRQEFECVFPEVSSGVCVNRPGMKILVGLQLNLVPFGGILHEFARRRCFDIARKSYRCCRRRSEVRHACYKSLTVDKGQTDRNDSTKSLQETEE
jgi:hypothetical protein